MEDDKKVVPDLRLSVSTGVLNISIHNFKGGGGCGRF